MGRGQETSCAKQRAILPLTESDRNAEPSRKTMRSRLTLENRGRNLTNCYTTPGEGKGCIRRITDQMSGEEWLKSICASVNKAFEAYDTRIVVQRLIKIMINYPQGIELDHSS